MPLHLPRALWAPWHPEIFHGAPTSRHFFEGWYFKIVDAPETHLLAIIPGVSYGDSRAASHAFVQVLDGRTGEAVYHRYPIDAFAAAAKPFGVRIDSNTFGLDKIHLDLHHPTQRLEGELRFTGLTPWPPSRLQPGAMGAFSFLPFMECYHGILSFNHKVDGTLTLNGSPIRFDGGRGYIEKDWGRGFPRAWIWAQSNHFATPATSISCSLAIIPYLRRVFPGFIIGLLHDTEILRFTTYNRSQLTDLEISEDTVAFNVKNAGYQLKIRATRTAGGILHAPVQGIMEGRILESLSATIEIDLYQITKTGATLILHDTGRNAGLEVAGDLNQLQRLVR